MKKFSLKDHLFNPRKVNQMAHEIKAVHPDFKTAQFVASVVEKFPELELKERINHITHCLKEFLPDAYREAVSIMLSALPEPCNPDLKDNDFGDYIYAPYHHFVAIHGCNHADLAFSLNALESLTTRFSAEDAIRYFINAFPKETMAKMKEWTSHSHYHVRRLASEGTRPTLPWCQKINISQEEALPILDQLYSDQTRYVTRSVANHLNDLSKKNPDIVVNTLKKWKLENKQTPTEMNFIVKHALRTRIKKGDPSALELIGIKANPPIEIVHISIPDSVKMNDYFYFDLELRSKEKTTLLIDYVLHFQNKKGEMNSSKVFKFKQVDMDHKKQIQLSKKHLMRQFMTTRTLYKGKHEFQLQINGTICYSQFFDLIAADE